MRQIKKLLVITFSAFSLLYSCNGNTNSITLKDTTSVTPSSTDATGDYATFSCKLDGKEFSGKGTDQNINAAFYHLRRK